MFYKIIISIYALLLALNINGQNYWISTSKTWEEGVSYKSIPTNDEGFISAGMITRNISPSISQIHYEIAKYDSKGIIDWRYSELAARPIINVLNVSELDNEFYIFYTNDSTTTLLNIDIDGNHISTQELNGIANDITNVEGTNFMVMYQELDTVRVSKYDSTLEPLWTISLPKIKFPAINHTYLDIDGNYRFIARHNSRISSAFDVAIGLDGKIKRNQELAFDPSGKGTPPSIHSGMVGPKSMVIISGENDVNSSLLRLYDVENLTITKTFNIFSFISFVEQMKTYDNHIYLMGRQRGNDFSGLMVFNSNLELVNHVKLDSMFKTIISNPTSSTIHSMEVLEQGILFSGEIQDAQKSTFRLDGFINRKGELTFIKDQKSNNSLILNFYPNPANDYVTVSWNGWAPSLLKVMSVDGNILHTQYISPESKEAKVNLIPYSKGIMIIEASSETIKKSQLIVKK